MTGSPISVSRISPADPSAVSPLPRLAPRQTLEISPPQPAFSSRKPGRPSAKKHLLQRYLPFLTGLSALLIYATTLSRGLALSHLALVAQLAGWDATPVTSQPLLWLLTAPLRWLPPAELPLAIDLSSAILAALVLGLLTRSVQLLPINRLHVQRMFLTNQTGRFRRPEAWLPPVLAAVVCGLFYSFWREATAGTGQMLDLVLVAAMCWCLLEHHASRKSFWRTSAVFLAGLNLAENWLTQLPLLTIIFFLSVVYAAQTLPLLDTLRRQGNNRPAAAAEVRRRFRQFVRLGLWLGAGLATFAFLPLINWLTPSLHSSLWQGITGTLGSLKHEYAQLFWNFRTSTLEIKLLLSLAVVSSVIPFLLKLRREPSYQTSTHGRLQLLGLHLFYAVCLLECLWLALEPDFGPQAVVLKTWNLSTPLLGLVYLNALGAGYLTAHFVLIFGADLAVMRRQNRHFRPPPFLPAASRRFVLPALFTLPLILAGLLVAGNAAAIVRPNRHPLDQFGQLALQSLPSTGGLLLTDDPVKRRVLQSAASHLNPNPWQIVDTTQLDSPAFRQSLGLLPPAAAAPRTDADQTSLVAWLTRVNATHPLFYLPTGPGSLLEWFQPEPAALAQALRPNVPAAAPAIPSPATLAAGEKFWNDHWESTRSAAPASGTNDALFAPVFKHLAMRVPPDEQSRLAAEWFSAALNTWAVQLQRHGNVLAAGRRLEQAIELNPDNFIARINLAANHDLKAGRSIAFDSSAGIMGQLKDTRQLLKILAHCGPVDDPFFCCLLGSIFTHQQLAHQALDQLERARQLAPTALAPDLLLAELYAGNGQSQALQATLKQLENLVATRPQNPALTAKLAEFENKIKSRPIADAEVQASLARGDLNDALDTIDRQLARTPENLKARVNQAGLYILKGQLTNGLATLNQILAVTNLPFARLDRAAIWLKLGNLAAAENDYRAVDQSGQATFQANYGLARVAEARHDTNQTKFYLQRCLASAPDPGTRSKVNSTLQELLKPDKS